MCQGRGPGAGPTSFLGTCYKNKVKATTVYDAVPLSKPRLMEVAIPYLKNS
jgi:hypothetical protein